MGEAEEAKCGREGSGARVRLMGIFGDGVPFTALGIGKRVVGASNSLILGPSSSSSSSSSSRSSKEDRFTSSSVPGRFSLRSSLRQLSRGLKIAPPSPLRLLNILPYDVYQILNGKAEGGIGI